MKRASIVLIGLVMILLAVDSHAVPVTLYYSSREIIARTTVNDDSIEGYPSYYREYTTYDGPFSGRVVSSSSNPSGSITATAVATQSTYLGVRADTGTLVSGGDMYLWEQTSIAPGSDGSAYSEGYSKVSMWFGIEGDAQYNFTFIDDAARLNDGVSAVGFTIQNMDTLDWILDGQTYPWSGTMGAGTYQFDLWMDGNTSFNRPSSAWFNLEITGAPASSVPEPSTLLLLGSGLVGLVGIGRRRFKK